MRWKFVGIQTNAGNDGLGITAASAIEYAVISQDVDFAVLNCQEADIDKIKEELTQMFNSTSYKVNLVNKMRTFTKIDCISANTGMATYLIYKDSVNIEIHHHEKNSIRRSGTSRLSKLGSAYNKGGLKNTVTITSLTSGDSIKVQTISAHLDRNDASLRNHDWAMIQKNIALTSEKNFEELASKLPDLVISGYDANTRNRFSPTKNTIIHLWEVPCYELNGLRQFPLGQIYSADSTYFAHNLAQSTKMNTYTHEINAGSLDFVAIRKNDRSTEQTPSSCSYIPSQAIPSADDSQRDHAVVISPVIEYTKPRSEFDQVKNYLACTLEHAAPLLARDICSLQDCKANRLTLVKLYNELLSSDQGALHIHLEKFTDNLSNHKVGLNEPWLKDLNIKEPLSTEHKLARERSQSAPVSIQYKNTIKYIQNDESSIEINPLHSSRNG